MIKRILLGSLVGLIVAVGVSVLMIKLGATQYYAGWVGGLIFYMILDIFGSTKTYKVK